ncbi:hypothetical protein E2562_026017 [Oryza meyeriana var. granulata]|uniref:Protein kinase domain-containing protein n=1 Tax=Oryza meyeriana var. granulata TaxID=110450 RepID=A0A6G1EPF4_9ORYZ|nr:hypothetical protein E2562_026017 [Oryza meyeriana var. granulata]
MARMTRENFRDTARETNREKKGEYSAMDAAAGISGGRRRLTRLRTLGRGASGAVVSLFAAGDDELLAVKSVAGPAGAAQLRREGGILTSLCSPHVLPCFGFGAVAGGEYRLLLEFAPGGSLADEVARHGGRLEEDDIRAYAADVARGLAYLHGVAMVHGDVKGRNVVIGADGRAKLADFGCARRANSAGPIGGTPAFMAPEVARGEEQGPAADVWALGCTVVEMATGRAPWSDMDDVVAAVRLIGYTDAVPEAPEWLSPEAKDFLDKCFRRRTGERWTAAQLLEHPFLAFAGCGGVKAEETKPKWVSPKSTLDSALWESDADDEDDDMPESSAERIMALAGPCSALPDWESDDGWIDIMRSQSELSITVVETPAEQSHSEVPEAPVASPDWETASYTSSWDERSEAERDADCFGADVDDDDELVHDVGVADAFVDEQLQDIYLDFTSDPIVLHVDISNERKRWREAGARRQAPTWWWRSGRGNVVAELRRAAVTGGGGGLSRDGEAGGRRGLVPARAGGGQGIRLLRLGAASGGHWRCRRVGLHGGWLAAERCRRDAAEGISWVEGVDDGGRSGGEKGGDAVAFIAVATGMGAVSYQGDHWGVSAAGALASRRSEARPILAALLGPPVRRTAWHAAKAGGGWG